MPAPDVTVKTVPALLVAARRMATLTNAGVPVDLGPAFLEAYDYIRKHGAQDNGPCLALWYGPENSHDHQDAEALVPVDRHLVGTDRVKVYELSQTQVASLIHFGNFKEFTNDHATLVEWINANGYKIIGPYREIYMKQDRTITEIQFPVERV